MALFGRPLPVMQNAPSAAPMNVSANMPPQQARGGLFGGSRRMLPSFNRVGQDGLSLADRLSAIGIAANDPAAAVAFRDARAQSRLDAPRIAAERQQMLAAITDPIERAVFMTNPEAWATSAAERFAPQVVAEGGLQSVYGYGAQNAVRNPRTREFGDSLVRDTPTGVETLATRQPTFQEQTSRISATSPINVAPGGRLFDPASRQVIGEGAERVFSAGQGVDLVTESGTPIYSNAAEIDPAAAQKEAGRAQNAITRIGQTRNAVARAREQAGAFTTGLGSLTAGIPGTPAANLRATIDTIQANLSFNELQQMREASPTGGALGGIAVRELDLLGATVASLNQSQSPQEFARSLDTIEQSLNRWEAVVRESQMGAQQRPQQGQGGQQSGGRVAYDAQGRRYVVRNGQWVPE
jgi:hypothetical protein